MKVLVTGANGMLGQDLCPILEDEGYDLIETDIDSLDITDYENAKKVIVSNKPDYIIHCAAYTNVDGAESEQDIAMKINYEGTKNLAKLCAEFDITLVYISTDYVFDGNKNSPYTQDDIPNPLNIYGYTKLKGEEAVKQLCHKYYIVRTSWLYGIHGKNFVETMIGLKDNNEIRVVNDQIGSPTWTVELSNGIAELIDEHECGIYHICGAGCTSWYEFAKEIFGYLSSDTKILPCTTEEYPRAAKRPMYSVMEPSVYTRKWQDALKDYMSLREIDCLEQNGVMIS